jgi:hypothetical protein
VSAVLLKDIRMLTGKKIGTIFQCGQLTIYNFSYKFTHHSILMTLKCDCQIVFHKTVPGVFQQESNIFWKVLLFSLKTYHPVCFPLL